MERIVTGCTDERMEHWGTLDFLGVGRQKPPKENNFRDTRNRERTVRDSKTKEYTG